MPLFADGQSSDPALSPDGTRLAFVVNSASTNQATFCDANACDWTSRYAQRELWLANADGANARRIEAAGSGVSMPRWIDDDTLLFVRSDKLWRLSVPSGDVNAVTGEISLKDPPAAAVYDPTEFITDSNWPQSIAIGPQAPAATPTTPSTFVMPDVTGMSVSDARAALRDFGSYVEEYVDDSPAHNYVVFQEPPKGTVLGIRSEPHLYECASQTCDGKVLPDLYMDNYEPATDWQSLDVPSSSLKTVANGKFITANDLVAAFAADLRSASEGNGLVIEPVYAPMAAGSATSVVLIRERNIPDDSVSGRDYELTLDASGQYLKIMSARSRSMCARGSVATDTCV
jgi:dipeptidyl aminopeptidase/acylaminoacyl peptidase